MFEFAEKMYFNEEAIGNKSTKDKFLKDCSKHFVT